MSNIILTTERELEALIQKCISEALREIGQQQAGNINDNLTIAEASKYLNLAVQTIYGLTSKRLIPYMKRGKKLNFSRKELDLWLGEGKKKTKQELENSESGTKT